MSPLLSAYHLITTLFNVYLAMYTDALCLIAYSYLFLVGGRILT